MARSMIVCAHGKETIQFGDFLNLMARSMIETADSRDKLTRACITFVASPYPPLLPAHHLSPHYFETPPAPTPPYFPALPPMRPERDWEYKFMTKEELEVYKDQRSSEMQSKHEDSELGVMELSQPAPTANLHPVAELIKDDSEPAMGELSQPAPTASLHPLS